MVTPNSLHCLPRGRAHISVPQFPHLQSNEGKVHFKLKPALLAPPPCPAHLAGGAHQAPLPPGPEGVSLWPTFQKLWPFLSPGYHRGNLAKDKISSTEEPQAGHARLSFLVSQAGPLHRVHPALPASRLILSTYSVLISLPINTMYLWDPRPYPISQVRKLRLSQCPWHTAGSQAGQFPRHGMGVLEGPWMMVLGEIQGHFDKTLSWCARFPIFHSSKGDSLIWVLLCLKHLSDTWHASLSLPLPPSLSTTHKTGFFCLCVCSIMYNSLPLHGL